MFSFVQGYSQVGVGITVDPRSIDELGAYSISDNQFSPVALDRYPWGVELVRYRDDQHDWIRYRVDGLIARDVNRSTEPMLDDDLLPVGTKRIENIATSKAYGLRIAIEQEYLIGDKCYGLLWGRGLSIATSRRSYERTASNPLGAYVGDTLEYDSRYRLASAIYAHAGAFYNFRDRWAASVRGAIGLQGTLRPDEQFLYIQSESGLATLISTREPSNGPSWKWDLFWRPSLVMFYYF